MPELENLPLPLLNATNCFVGKMNQRIKHTFYLELQYANMYHLNILTIESSQTFHVFFF